MPGTKRLDTKFLTHLSVEVKKIIDRDFAGVQRGPAEKALGISQSHISQLIRGEFGERGPGLWALLKLRDYTGLSLDALLGLPPVGNDRLLARLDKVEQRLADLPADRPQRSTIRPARKSR